MVRKQMKEMSSDPATNKDYLSEKLPAPKLPALESPWFQAEIKRVVEATRKGASNVEGVVDAEMQAQTKMSSRILVGEASYSQVVVDPKDESVSAYQTALNRAQVNFET